MDNDQDIERLLRKAPAPPTPPGLEQRLQGQVGFPRQTQRPSWSWASIFQERSWAPAMAVFVILAGLIGALAFQQSALKEIKAQQQLIEQDSVAAEPSASATGQLLQREYQELQKQAAELKALRAEMAEIEQAIAEGQRLAVENQVLRAELQNLVKSSPESSPEFQAALAEAKKKAERIKCVNNMKNIGLAARIWATDQTDQNKDHLPRDFISMKNELSTPKILICPSDASRADLPATNWEQFTAASSSYELLSPGVSELMPQVVYARCPLHNNVGLADGSVHQLGPNDQVIQHDGRWIIAGRAE